MENQALARAKKKADRIGETILFVDESALYVLPGVARTYAPIGETPILKEHHAKSHLSLISAISPEGHTYFSIQDHSFKSGDVVRFLKHLLRQVPGKIRVIWDGAGIHKSKVVREFLGTVEGNRLWLELLPPYAPDLNPDEGVWNLLKNFELANVCCRNVDELLTELRLAIRRLRRRTKALTGCFAGAGLALK